MLTASLGGPVGTLAGLGPDGPAIAARFAAECGLGGDPVAWHTRRSRIAETGTWLARLMGSLAKLATDVVALAATEVGEVAEPHVPGRGGSSAMPHKRNPVGATVILAAFAAARGHAATLLDAMPAAHERPAGPWHAEWHALPQLFGLASGALREARALAEGLTVDAGRMRANLDLTAACSSPMPARPVSPGRSARERRMPWSNAPQAKSAMGPPRCASLSKRCRTAREWIWRRRSIRHRRLPPRRGRPISPWPRWRASYPTRRPDPPSPELPPCPTFPSTASIFSTSCRPLRRAGRGLLELPRHHVRHVGRARAPTPRALSRPALRHPWPWGLGHAGRAGDDQRSRRRSLGTPRRARTGTRPSGRPLPRRDDGSGAGRCRARPGPEPDPDGDRRPSAERGELE